MRRVLNWWGLGPLFWVVVAASGCHQTHWRGDSHFEQRGYALAIVAYETQLREKKGTEQTLFRLGVAHLASGSPDKFVNAKIVFDDLIAQYPDTQYSHQVDVFLQLIAQNRDLLARLESERTVGKGLQEKIERISKKTTMQQSERHALVRETEKLNKQLAAAQLRIADLETQLAALKRIDMGKRGPRRPK